MKTEFVESAPRGEMEGQLHFSYSQLSTFLICPMKYAHQYVWGTPWESKPIALPFGKAVHRAALIYYLCLKETGEIIPLGQMIDTFVAVYDGEIKQTQVEISLKEGETIAGLRDQGIELLKLFHKEIQPQKIAGVEVPFSVSVPDLLNGSGDLPIKLVGYFDLVERDEQGTYLIVELKTSAQRFSSLRLEFDQQATVYSYAIDRMKLGTTENSCLIRYDVLLKQKKVSFERYFVTRSEADQRRLIHLINHVLRAIELRVFYRNTSWACADCVFKKACFA